MYADVRRDWQILPFFPALLENQKLSVVLIMLKYVQFCCGMVVGGFVGRNNATKCDYSVDFMEKTHLCFTVTFWCFFHFDAISEPPLIMSSFTDLKLLVDLTPAEITDLTERCYNDCTEIDGHLLYKGENRPTYPQITFTLRARRFQMRKSQLSLFLKLKVVISQKW